jgi:hypothetical protein
MDDLEVATRSLTLVVLVLFVNGTVGPSTIIFVATLVSAATKNNIHGQPSEDLTLDAADPSSSKHRTLTH